MYLTPYEFCINLSETVLDGHLMDDLRVWRLIKLGGFVIYIWLHKMRVGKENQSEHRNEVAQTGEGSMKK